MFIVNNERVKGKNTAHSIALARITANECSNS